MRKYASRCALTGTDRGEVSEHRLLPGEPRLVERRRKLAASPRLARRRQPLLQVALEAYALLRLPLEARCAEHSCDVTAKQYTAR